jgi:cellulose biosynthesis protein BcsQ
MAQGGGRGWFHRKRAQPQPVDDAPKAQDSRVDDVSELIETSHPGEPAAPSLQGDASQVDWSPEARRSVQPPTVITPPAVITPPTDITPPVDITPPADTGSRPQSNHPGSVGRTPETSPGTSTPQFNASQADLRQSEISPENEGASPMPGTSDSDDAAAGAETKHASATNQAYDWDAATAAALSDEPDAPRSRDAARPVAASSADRLLEDIIREIVGDAAMDTATSLHPTRSRGDGIPLRTTDSTATVPEIRQPTDPAPADAAITNATVANLTDTNSTDMNASVTNTTDANTPVTNTTDANSTDANGSDENGTDASGTDTNSTDTDAPVTNVAATNSYLVGGSPARPSDVSDAVESAASASDAGTAESPVATDQDGVGSAAVHDQPDSAGAVAVVRTDDSTAVPTAAQSAMKDDAAPVDQVAFEVAVDPAERTEPETTVELAQSGDAADPAEIADTAHDFSGPVDTDDATPESGSSDSSTAVAAPDRPNHTLPAPWPSKASIAATTTGQGIDVSRETLDRPIQRPVSRETESEHGGTPLADQLADETRRRVALDEAVLPLPPSTRVLTISNQKGGVGKTTSAVNLAAALARAGAQVLVIDLDPQGNASTALGVDHRSEEQSVYEVLVGDLPLTDVIRSSTEHERLDCVPATIHLAGAEIELVSLVAREQRLRRALDRHLAAMEHPYDYVFIDCPPSLGLLTINAFVAAREVLIPIQCEYYALEGLSQLLSNIELIEKHLNPELRLSTILLTMYDSRTNLAQQVAQEVRDHFPSQTLETIIPRSVRVSEAPSYGQSVISYDFASSGSLSYREAAAEIARRSASNQKETTDGN